MSMFMRTQTNLALRAAVLFRAAALFSAAALLLSAVPAAAHHAFAAEFDDTKPVKLRGKITKVDWINPHAWIHIAVTNDDGTVDNWMIEAGPPGALVRRGWKKDSVAPGTEVLIEGYRAIDNSFRANGRDVTLPDGRRLFAGSSGTGAPRDGADPDEPTE